MINKAEVNTGRQFEFDVAKSFAIIFMIIVHTFDHMTQTNGNILPKIIEFLGCPPAAGVFMFAMGLGISYTKHSSPKEFAKRGIKLVIMGYVLNFFRETILLIIGKLCSVSNSYEGVSIFSSLMAIDILQFAGLSFILVALFKKIKLKPYIILIIAIVMNIISYLTIGIFENSSEYVQYPVGLLFFTNSNTSFPLFSWFIYPALGICFGSILKHINLNEKNRLYRYILCVSITLLIIVSIFCKLLNYNITSFFMTDLYFKQIPITFLWCICIVLIFISLYYFLSKLIKGRGENIIKYLSSNVNTIYIIQWLIICYTIAIMEIFNVNLFSTVWAIPIGIIITIMCIYISKFWNKIKQKHY